MAKSVEDTLLETFTDPGAVAGQADLAQAVALSRQTLSFRQRAGAAAARLRRAETPEEMAEARVALGKRENRLVAAERQTQIANIKRPVATKDTAQVFGRTSGTPENPPLTLAAIDEKGTVRAQADANASGVFHLVSKAALTDVTLQVSDAAQCVFYRSPAPVDIPLGAVYTLAVNLDRPDPKPSPVPTNPTMPDLVGQGDAMAKTLLDCLGVTDVRITDKREDGPADIVITQAPKAGTAIKGDTAVSLTVRRPLNGTPTPAVLPDFKGMPLARASAALKKLKLDATVTRQADDGPADIVLDQSPDAGTAISGIDAVTLTMSDNRPPAPQTVTVPNLIGKSAEVAKEILNALDLGMDVKQTAKADIPAGITEQSPAGGAVVPRKSTVTVVVNTPPDVEPALVVVPRLIGRPEGTAKQIIEKLGLVMRSETVTDAGEKGTVVKQDPEADARVAAGSTVAVFISDGGGGQRPGRDFERLTGLIKADPRSAADGLDLTASLRTAKVTDLDSARALAALTPAQLRDRLKLADVQAATKVRAILRRAFKDLDG